MKRIVTPAVTVSGVLSPSNPNSIGPSYSMCDGTTFRILDTSDFYALSDPDLGYVPHWMAGSIYYEANGQTGYTSSLTGAVTGGLVDGSTHRLGIVADPHDALKKCWHFRCTSTDTNTAGSKRTEFAVDSNRFPARKGQRILMGFKMRLPNWSAASNDEQLVWQIHGSGDQLTASPWVAHVIRGGIERIVLIYDEAATTTGGTRTMWNAYTSSNIPYNVWRTVIVETAHSFDGGGYLRLWFDGVKVLDYSGKLGYQEPTLPSYPKIGVYHWEDSGNTWDPALPVREAWYKGPFLCRPHVSVADLQALLDSI